MKPYLLIITLLAFSILYGCKREEVKPQSTRQSQTATTGKDSTLAHPTGGVTSSDSNTLATITLPATVSTPQAMIAKWSLVRDTSSWCFGADTVHQKKYTGTPSDYFDFRADGKCYTKEGSVYDTLTYSVRVNNQIIIQKFGVNVNGYYLPNVITQLTDHSFTIASIFFPGAGGWSRRALYLQK
jgi:hypothetical protein